ncbi:MAG TPA: MFS transporter [Enterococcus columbae]|nr:MFS transporter [Enterococcus columbae]
MPFLGIGGIVLKQTNVKLVTIAIFVATFMTAVEGTIVTTAMPTIVGSLHGIELMNWVFSIYLLTSAMLTPIYGKLTDKIGRKPVFMVGTLLFIIGSALCGLSFNMHTLILSRALQGMGAGALMPVSLTLLADLYPIEKRTKVMGYNSTMWGIASVIGPLAGGLIVDTIGWHWIFFINVPIGLVQLLLVFMSLHEEKRVRQTKKMDLLGSFLLMFVLLTLLASFQLLSDQGFHFMVLACLVASVLFLALFIKIEKQAQDPIITLSLFNNPLFIGVNLVAALVSGILMGVDIYIPMWMQGVSGLAAGIGGLVLAPISLFWVVGTNFASKLLTKHSIRRVIFIGLLFILVTTIGLFIAPINMPAWYFVILMFVFGLGMGMVIVSTTITAQQVVPKSHLGEATSFNTLVRTIGQTVMVAIFGLIFNFITNQSLNQVQLAGRTDLLNQFVNPKTADQVPEMYHKLLRQVLYDGLHMTFLMTVVLVGVSILCVVVYIRNQVKMNELN